ncbi:MAG TPA: hypothetical protein VM782_11605 [Stellaceae bacterium]|nr:hypothetical protein [Stellaceae bacterium]
MQPVLIDEDGEPRPVTFWKIAYRAGLAAPDIDIISSAVSRLGLIHIFPMGRSLLVSLRPHLVTSKTMVGAFYHIYDFNPERIMLDSSESDPPELYYGCQGVFRRIYWLLSSAEDAGFYRRERWPVA